MKRLATAVAVTAVLLAILFAIKYPSKKPNVAQPSFARANNDEAGVGAGLGQNPVVVDARSEEVIKGALRYLAKAQGLNGSWSSDDRGKHAALVTSQVLMAYVASGHLPDEGEHGKTVTGGMNFLLGSVKPDGFIGAGADTNIYEHAMATIVLAELYSQTKDPRIKAKLESAIKLIVAYQNPDVRHSAPRQPDNIEVMAAQCVALRAGKNVGIDVFDAAMDRTITFVRDCYDKRSGGFSNLPAGDPGFAQTAAGIFSLQVCGQHDEARVKDGAKYLEAVMNDNKWFTNGQFNAMPAIYMIGGKSWQERYSRMSKLICDAAVKDGRTYSWKEEVEGGRGAGPVYSAAVYTTILALPYHYVALYQR